MQSAGWCGVANVELNYGEIMQEPTNQPPPLYSPILSTNQPTVSMHFVSDHPDI